MQILYADDHHRPIASLSSCLIGAAILTAALVSPARADVRFVDADAAEGGDGLSWETAYRSLQDALDDAAGNHQVDQIWVAEGSYVPVREARPGDLRSVTFALLDGVALYGGFAGDEQALPERDIENHPTVLSGDVDGDDADPFLNRDENAYTVLTADQVSITLDGFVISGGNSNGEEHFADGSGGALYISQASAVVSRCRFEDNEALTGGALYVIDPSTRVEVVSCVLLRNRALFGDSSFSGFGGATCATGLTQPTVRYANSLFVGNYAQGGGAAILADHGLLDIVHCTIVGNECVGGPPNWGAAVELMGTVGMITISNSVVWGNRSENPAGIELMQVRVPLPLFMVSVDASCLEAWSGGFPGAGSHGLDPLFVDPIGPDGEAGTGDEDLHLIAGSPCVDAADADRIPADVADIDDDDDDLEPLPLDLDGLARISGTTTDMGSFERPLADCGSDVTGDEVVGLADLLLLLTTWGPCGSCERCVADLDGSCDVGFGDLVMMLSDWGACP